MARTGVIKIVVMDEKRVVSYLVYYHPSATSGERLICGLLFRVGVKWHLMLNKDPTRYCYGFGDMCSIEDYQRDIHHFVTRFLETPILSIATIRSILPLHMSLRYYAHDYVHDVPGYMNELFRAMVAREIPATEVPLIPPSRPADGG